MKKYNIILAVIFLATFASCGSTKITSSWREPDKEITINKLNKVLIVALLDNETSRRKAEDQMVAYLNGKGLVFYNYLNESFNEKDEGAIRNKIRDDGFDGAVTMRLVDVDKEEIYTKGNFSLYPNYNRNFSEYYFRNRQNFYTPGYYSTTKTYIVETNVYSIKENKIIWSGLTKTIDPKGIKKMTGEIAKVVYRKMIGEGFISE